MIWDANILYSFENDYSSSIFLSNRLICSHLEIVLLNASEINSSLKENSIRLITYLVFLFSSPNKVYQKTQHSKSQTGYDNAIPPILTPREPTEICS